jgi:hypothetical protein
MILRAMPTVAELLVGSKVKGDGPERNGYPGSPCWWLGVREIP